MLPSELILSPEKRVWQSAKYLGLHFLVLIVGYIIYAKATNHSLFMESDNFLNWDANWYNRIRQQGYFFYDGAASSVAFFPAFPYLWKIVQLNTYGIMLFNTVLFVSSLLLLVYNFNISSSKLILFCSIPSVFFLYLPYSEALFFLTSTLLLIGLKTNRTWLIITGFLFCSITRSAANVFIPAIIIMELLTGKKGTKIYRIVLFSLICLIGVFLVSWFQFLQTGEWLGFIKTQKHWGHFLQFPKFPFGTTEATIGVYKNSLRILFFDAGALALGVSAIILSIRFIYLKIRTGNLIIDRAYFFALLYLAGVTFVSLAFKGKTVYSLNRYLLPTAFCFIFLNGETWQNRVNLKSILVFFLLLTCFWQVFNAFMRIDILLKFILLSLYLCLFILTYYKQRRVANSAFIIVYSVNIVLQLYLLFRFLDCEWVA